MWCRLKSRVPAETVDNLLGRAGSVVSSSGSKESLHWVGKDFFGGSALEPDKLDLLRLFHLEIWPEISSTLAFENPCH